MEVTATITEQIVEEVFVNGIKAEKLDQRGFCRQVFKLGKLFIKFDNPSMNIGECKYQTKYELQILHFIPKNDLDFFCLPLTSGVIDGLYYTVQEEANHEAIPTDSDVCELEAIITRNFLSDIGFFDNTPHNCAFTKNGWKIYDYAFLQNV